MNTQKSYGKTRVCSNALSDPTSTNLSTVRNSEYIYYNIFWAFYMAKTLKYSIIVSSR